jgi:hypothetical protein
MQGPDTLRSLHIWRGEQDLAQIATTGLTPSALFPVSAKKGFKPTHVWFCSLNEGHPEYRECMIVQQIQDTLVQIEFENSDCLMVDAEWVFPRGRSGDYLSNDGVQALGAAVLQSSQRTKESLDFQALQALELMMHGLCCKVEALGSRFRAHFGKNERCQELPREVGVKSMKGQVKTPVKPEAVCPCPLTTKTRRCRIAPSFTRTPAHQ